MKLCAAQRSSTQKTSSRRRRDAFFDLERASRISVCFLTLHGVRAAVRYDETRLQVTYGRDGGDPFASYIADVICHRVTDWYRSKAEGHGDRRYNNDNRLVLDGDMSYSEPGGRLRARARGSACRGARRLRRGRARRTRRLERDGTRRPPSHPATDRGLPGERRGDTDGAAGSA
jgi:hypothetical protein